MAMLICYIYITYSGHEYLYIWAYIYLYGVTIHNQIIFVPKNASKCAQVINNAICFTEIIIR